MGIPSPPSTLMSSVVSVAALGWICNISVFEENVFRWLSSLETLYLHYNSITVIHTDQFNGLSSCTRLDLPDNDISLIEENALLGLSRLRALNLNHNNITTIGTDKFTGLSSCAYLWLSSNDISEIEDGAFNYRTDLEHMYLHCNKLTTLSSELFMNQPHPLDLHLSSPGSTSDNLWDCETLC